MMKSKRFLSILICIVVLLTCSVIYAMAEDEYGEVTSTSYDEAAASAVEDEFSNEAIQEESTSDNSFGKLPVFLIALIGFAGIVMLAGVIFAIVSIIRNRKLYSTDSSPFIFGESSSASRLDFFETGNGLNYNFPADDDTHEPEVSEAVKVPVAKVIEPIFEQVETPIVPAVETAPEQIEAPVVPAVETAPEQVEAPIAPAVEPTPDPVETPTVIEVKSISEQVVEPKMTAPETEPIIAAAQFIDTIKAISNAARTTETAVEPIPEQVETPVAPSVESIEESVEAPTATTVEFVEEPAVEPQAAVSLTESVIIDSVQPMIDVTQTTPVPVDEPTSAPFTAPVVPIVELTPEPIEASMVEPTPEQVEIPVVEPIEEPAVESAVENNSEPDRLVLNSIMSQPAETYIPLSGVEDADVEHKAEPISIEYDTDMLDLLIEPIDSVTFPQQDSFMPQLPYEVGKTLGENPFSDVDKNTPNSDS